MEPTWVPVRVNGALLFRYDPTRRRIEIKRGPVRIEVDLTQYDARVDVECPGGRGGEAPLVDNADGLRYTDRDGA